MNKLVLFGAFVLLCAALTGCKDDDPDYSNVTPPVVEVAPNTLTGYVTNMQGQALANAQVTAGSLTAKTDNNGLYTISGIAPGNYTLTASMTGMVSQSTTLTVAETGKTQNLSWSVALPKEVSQNVNVTVNNGGSGGVESEAITGNVKGEIEMKVSVAPNTVPENTVITITPIYTEDSSKITKASDLSMLIGANITCSNSSLQINQDLNVSFNVDNTVVNNVVTRQLVNGSWVDVPHSSTNDGVVVSTRRFAPIGLFFNVNINETTGSQAVTLNPSEWDNLYGNSDLKAGEATYSYKLGSEFDARGANTLEALLIERLASIVGPTYRELNASYPVNVTLPIGTAIALRGSQQTKTVTVSSGNRSVSGTQYGTVTVTATSYNRQHDGGTN